MRKFPAVIFAVLLSVSPAAHAADAAPIVFFDIAGPDMAKLSAFYSGVFGWNVDATGGIKNAGLDGTLRQDPAAKIIYLGVPDVTAALNQVVAAGGAIVVPRFAVPGVAVIGLFKDPAGNGMGLVEMKDGKPVIP
jgi:predicted enzyme related to lactoylglutathione lyase